MYGNATQPHMMRWWSAHMMVLWHMVLWHMVLWHMVLWHMVLWHMVLWHRRCSAALVSPGTSVRFGTDDSNPRLSV
jgi:hypothetical protein